MLVTVAAFREPYEAHLFRGRLKAEGIFAVVSHEYWIGNDWPMSVAFGGVKVQVVGEEYQTARGIERACCRGEFRDLLQENLGDLDDPACPFCGDTRYRKRRPFLRAATAIFISLTTNVVVPPVGWILRCEACGKEYRGPRRFISACKMAVLAAGLAVALAWPVMISLWNHWDFLCRLGRFCG